MIIFLQIILIFLIPYIIIRFKDFKLTKMLGTIGMAYLSGLFLALLLYLINLAGLNINISKDVGEISSFGAIAIGIPLLLFSSNLKQAKKLSKMVLIAFSVIIVSVVLVTSIVFYLFAKDIPNGAYLSAGAIGLYTGGTPNFNAIFNIFGLDSQTIALANLSDIIIGALFYVFLLTLAKPFVKLFLKDKKSLYLSEETFIENSEDFNVKDFKTNKPLLKTVFLAFTMAVLGGGVGILVWIIQGMRDGRMFDALIPSLLISVTVFGIIGSFNKKVRETKGNNIVGHYLILVFSFALSSAINFLEITGDFSKLIILYGVITVGSFVVAMIISRFFKIDADCMIVCATAGIYGPAFVPAITKQLKNDSLTAPGLIVGSIGYAIGTFIGLLLGLLYAL